MIARWSNPGALAAQLRDLTAHRERLADGSVPMVAGELVDAFEESHDIAVAALRHAVSDQVREAVEARSGSTAARVAARGRQEPSGEARRGVAVRDEAARHLDGAPGALLAAFPDKRRVEMGETGTGRQEGDGERAGEASMQPIPGTETLHSQAQLAGAIAFAIVMGALMAWSQFRGRREALKSKAQSEDAARSTATALVAVTPTADRLTHDTLI